MGAEQLQVSGDALHGSSAVGWSARRFIQGLDDVAAAEAVETVFTTQDGLEQFLFQGVQEIQATAVSAAIADGLAELIELACRGCGTIYHGQRIEVAQVGSQGHFVIAVEVGHALAHGTPGHLGNALAGASSSDMELAWLVDDGFDAQDHAELVVHFEPVALHAVLDAGAGAALFAAEGKNLAIELRIETSAEEAQDVVRGEVRQGMVDHLWVERLQVRATAEEHIAAELGLVDDPVVRAALQPFLFEQWVDLTGPAFEDFWPRQLRKTFGQTLSFSG